MEVLNDSFSNTPFYFTLVPKITFHMNETWTRYPESYGQEISETLGFPDLKVLNVFLVYNAVSLEGDEAGEITVGFANLPAWQGLSRGDGVYVRYDALPRGGLLQENFGYTLPHEVGTLSGVNKRNIPSLSLSHSRRIRIGLTTSRSLAGIVSPISKLSRSRKRVHGCQ